MELSVFVRDALIGPTEKVTPRAMAAGIRRASKKAAAQGALDALRFSARQETYATPGHRTLRALLEQDWLPPYVELAESTWESYERNIRHHIVPAIGGIQLQALDGGASKTDVRLPAQLRTEER